MGRTAGREQGVVGVLLSRLLGPRFTILGELQMHTEMECGRSCARARSNLNAGVQRFSASSSGVSPQGPQCGQQLCLLKGTFIFSLALQTRPMIPGPERYSGFQLQLILVCSVMMKNDL